MILVRVNRSILQNKGWKLSNAFFCNFWDTGDYNLQNCYLSKLLSWDDCKVTRIKNRPSKKLRTIQYSVLVNGEKKAIYRQAFYSVHGITEKRV